jgi:hypothetical protein
MYIDVFNCTYSSFGFYFVCCFPVGMRRQSATIRQRRYAEYWKKKNDSYNGRQPSKKVSENETRVYTLYTLNGKELDTGHNSSPNSELSYWEELKWLQICEFLIEIIFILFLNTTLFYNFMLPVNRYLAMNTFCRSMTYYQKSYSLPLKGLRPL